MSKGIGGLALLALVLCLRTLTGAITPSTAAAAARTPAVAGPTACDPARVVGVWTAARYSMEILADKTYRASGTPNMAAIDVIGTFDADRCNATIVDTSGRFACPANEIGRYTFTVTDTTLAFALVSDPCDGRRIPLTRGPLTRRRTAR